MCLLVLEIIPCFNNLICESAKSWLSSRLSPPLAELLPGLLHFICHVLRSPQAGRKYPVSRWVKSSVLLWPSKPHSPKPNALYSWSMSCESWLPPEGHGRAAQPVIRLLHVSHLQRCVRSQMQVCHQLQGIAGCPDVWGKLLHCVSLVRNVQLTSAVGLDEELGIKWDRICFSSTDFCRDTRFLLFTWKNRLYMGIHSLAIHFKDSESRSFMLNMTTPGLITPSLITLWAYSIICLFHALVYATFIITPTLHFKKLVLGTNLHFLILASHRFYFQAMA